MAPDGTLRCPDDIGLKDSVTLDREYAERFRLPAVHSSERGGKERWHKPFIMDELATAPIACWSVSHKLKESFTDSLLRLRVGSTETDVGYVDDRAELSDGEVDTATISSAAGTSAGYVAKLYDQSGNGRDLSQATAAAQPRIYSGTAIDVLPTSPTETRLTDKPAMVFDGVDDYLQRDDLLGLSGDTAITVYAAFKANGVTAAEPASAIEIGTHPSPDASADTSDGFQVGQSMGSLGLVFLFVLRTGFVGSDSLRFFRSDMNKNHSQVLVARYFAGQGISATRATKNGCPLAVEFDGFAQEILLNLQSGATRIGYDGEVGPTHYKMSMSSLAVWNTALSDEDVVTLSDWSLREYGISRWHG
jgi:hypothetical protein